MQQEKKQMSIIRKPQDHTLQTDTQDCEDKSHNSHKTPGRQKKQSN